MKSSIWCLSFAICFLISGVLNAQDSRFEGIILDAESDQTIPYAHIYRVEGGGGTTSNSSGRFTYQTADSNSFTLTISAVGYESKTVSSDRFNPGEQLTILLRPVVYQSADAVVTAGSFSSYRVRNRRSLFNRAAKNLQSPPVEHVAFGFAQMIKPEKTPVWPTQFRFRIDTGDRLFSEDEEQIRENNRGNFTYRLRFVKADSAGMPTETDLVSTPLTVTVPAEQGWVEFDLEKEMLLIDESPFFLLVEWLIDEIETQEILPFYEIKWEKDSHYYRLNPLSRWRESQHGLIFDFRYDG